MVQDRVNNTGPGIKATAGYILKKGGLSAESDEIKQLLALVDAPQSVTDKGNLPKAA